ncbi:MAG: lysylphosphatidylglycerol synthase transmembrane domain-containing protein [bacterium]
MRRWLVIVASLAIVLALVKVVGFREVADTWRSVAPAAIAVSVLAYYASLAVRILAWRVLIGADSPPYRRLAGPLAIGFVLGHVAPAKSGEPVAALLAARASGLPLSRTLSVLAAERGLQLLTLLATFLPAAARTAGSVLAVRSALPAAAVALVLVLLGFLRAPALLAWLRPRLAALPRVGPGAARFADQLRALLLDRGRLVRLVPVGILFWTLQYVSLWAILRGGGAAVNLIEAATVAGAAILGGTLTLLPLGTQDGISALVLGGLGVPLARGFSLALFHTALSLGCGAALALIAPALAGRDTPATRREETD